MEDKVNEFETIDSEESMSLFIDRFRVISSNHRNEEGILETINKTIRKCNQLNDRKSLVKLYEMKMSQIEHQKEEHQNIVQIIQQMKDISKEINYMGGLALAYYKEWYIEKHKGNDKKSIEAINNSINYVTQYLNSENYEYNVCKYSFAVEIWLSKREPIAPSILEECANYFYKNNFYRSFVQSLSLLVLIYQQTQNKEKSIQLVRRIIQNKNVLHKMPLEIQAIIDYFIGVNHRLNLNINEAKHYFLKSQNNLRGKYKKSVYLGYFLRCQAHLTACYALQGELELALNQMKEVEELIEESVTTRNLDSFSKKQIEHDFNLIKFYIHSRLQNFQTEDLSELIQVILENIKKQHSDPIFFSEFILNTNFSEDQLERIKNLNNPSTKRVQHIITFLIEKITHSEEIQVVELIQALKNRTVEERMTFVEKAFADLLAAQEYYKLNRFAEIYPLLRKYENQLHRIEVLELRIFMEAFIQVGAFNNGDPLGPALQYMAIKKCREYGFSRLENKLLYYLFLQESSILKVSG